MNKYFEGELLEVPITYKEWKLRWSRTHKDKLKEYCNIEIECPYCIKTIKKAKLSIHRESKQCKKNQDMYLVNLLIDIYGREIIFTTRLFKDIEKYFTEEFIKVKKDKEKFENNLVEYILDEVENIKKKY